MKKLLFLCLLLPCLFVACSSDDDKNPGEGTEITKIEINKIESDVYVGGDYTLKVTHTPAKLDAPTYTWASSDVAVATVDKDGKLHAIKSGKTTITATAGKLTSTLEVTVKDVPVTAVKLDKATHELLVGESFTLTATYEPAEAANVVIQFTSSDEAVATVSQEGVVTTLTAGTTTITAAVGDVKATCAVTVKAIPLTALKISEATKSIFVDETFTLTATGEPSNAVLPTLVWKTSDQAVATVNASGEVLAKGAGTATITVTAAGTDISATCAVTVKAILLTGVKLNATTKKMVEGEKFTLVATGEPSNAVLPTLGWATSNSAVAEVNGNGELVAKGVGTATITVTAAGTSFSATCVVTVTDISGLFATKTKTYKGGAIDAMQEGTDVTITATNNSTVEMKNVQYAIEMGPVGSPTLGSFKTMGSGTMAGGTSLEDHLDKISGVNLFLVFKFTVEGKEYTVRHEYDALD